MFSGGLSISARLRLGADAVGAPADAAPRVAADELDALLGRVDSASSAIGDAYAAAEREFSKLTTGGS